MFENLTAEVATLPGVTRNSDAPNPFKEMLSASFADGQGRAVTIPAESVAEAMRLIRRAAEQLKIGARIVVDTGKKGERPTPAQVQEWADKKSKVKIRVLFQGKERRKLVRTKKTAETTPVVETAAAPVADTVADTAQQVETNPTPSAE